MPELQERSPKDIVSGMITKKEKENTRQVLAESAGIEGKVTSKDAKQAVEIAKGDAEGKPGDKSTLLAEAIIGLAPALIGGLVGGAEGAGAGAEAGIVGLGKIEEEKERQRQKALAEAKTDEERRRILEQRQFQVAQAQEERKFTSGEKAKDRALQIALAQSKQTGEQQKPPTASQFNVATLVSRANQANQMLESLISQEDVTGLYRGLRKEFAPEFLKGESIKRQNQAEKNFLTAVLRKESGAAISESEFDLGAEVYFPRPGDTPAVLAQKEQSRRAAIAGLMAEAGPALQMVQQNIMASRQQSRQPIPPQQQPIDSGSFLNRQAIAEPRPLTQQQQIAEGLVSDKMVREFMFASEQAGRPITENQARAILRDRLVKKGL